ncbi:protein TIFY 11e [Sorghum bicolor]|uniref:Protein TIFY n=1 Tax=Sorghum bicolor TaxID=4558 RepID=A0A1B6QL30_SORBI|nr:protein TIFY 11e [Sorghum bicolor]KXG38629.1 hypothetical protein SORBI_3001G259900 [Sorghum bicolor]|eukprot:XP_002464691.2 protein TIFY 11e [Sorghum bicolor]
MAAAAPWSGSNTATTTTTSRFAAACGALSQYVKAAEAERTTRTRPPAAVRPLPLMPGADVDQDHDEQPETAAAQLTIVYGGRALVLDDVTADKAADLLRLAAAARGGTEQLPLSSVADLLLPVARKASLQRFIEKRKDRVAAGPVTHATISRSRCDLTKRVSALARGCCAEEAQLSRWGIEISDSV